MGILESPSVASWSLLAINGKYDSMIGANNDVVMMNMDSIAKIFDGLALNATAKLIISAVRNASKGPRPPEDRDIINGKIVNESIPYLKMPLAMMAENMQVMIVT